MFREPDKNTWILLARHFAGETMAEEETEISEWLREPDHYTLYNQIKSDWNMLENMKTQFNTEQAWTKIHKRITQEGQVDRTVSGSSQQPVLWKLRPSGTLIRIAASVLIILTAGFVLYMAGIFPVMKSGNIDVVTLANEEIKTVLLPDGSQVFLNSGTTLTYPRLFKNETREVSLQGEAFFDVAADASDPFVIRADGALVKAVGTSFNVYARENEQHVDVFVESGRVELIEADNTDNHIMLESGYIGTLTQNEVNSRKSGDKNCIAWKTKQMVFYNTPLSEVLKILSDVYKVEINIREAGIDTTQIIGEYNNDPLDHILKVICTQNNLKIEKSDNKIYLSRI
ncbi:MAG: FecR domain-containing protein [Bacteroidales bacterium]|nr:FecR domain-containing protein [Bacteroidales bacterium]